MTRSVVYRLIPVKLHGFCMKKFWVILLIQSGLLAFIGGCGGTIEADSGLTGSIKIDGSSTVLPISEAMAASYMRLNPGVNITVGSSGTGGGFKKFSSGETDISDASRPIKPAEVKACHDNGIFFIELQVAWDGVSVIINNDNPKPRKMTVAQLKKIWHPNENGFKNATKWSDVQEDWPDEPIKLYGPGPDSGTFDYFTDEINGEEGLCRRDYGRSENDNSIIQGVLNNTYAMGFLGFAYYRAHVNKLTAVAIQPKGETKFVAPSDETILDKTYKPLSRPLFIYVKKSSLKRAEVRSFVRFYLRRTDIVEKVGYVQPGFYQQYEMQNEILKPAIDGLALN